MLVEAGNVVVYSSAYCGYCRAAVQFLETVKGQEVTVVDLTGDWAARKALIERTRHRTVPQIFVGDTFVGGYDELRALDSAGKLDLLLGQVNV
jgi:glutaredoxin 3